MEQNLTRIFTLFGGLTLFLYGMDALSHSLETAAGSRLKSLLAAVTGSPVRGVLAGAAVTAVLQSSSAVTVMVLGFVSAGLLTLRQAVPVIFGCNIGTTVTAQLLAFRLEDVRGLVLLAGLLLCFACAGRKGRAIGRAVFAFGLLFEGIADMGTAMEPLAQSPVFVHWLGRVRQHPWLGGSGAAAPMAGASGGAWHDPDSAEQLGYHCLAAELCSPPRAGRQQSAGSCGCAASAAGR